MVTVPVRGENRNAPPRLRSPVLPPLPERRSLGLDQRDGRPARRPDPPGLLTGHQPGPLRLRELVLVPQQGRLRLRTELGILDVAPGELAVVPRGIRFAADPLDGAARGYVCENYGAPLTLPEHGLIGPNGLADPRDFRYPTAAVADDPDRPTRVVQRFGGALWEAAYDHSPLDVVGWRGTYAPYAYDLSRFTTLGTVSWDHPDPSIYTVLTSPSELPGLANVDVVVFPPRWLVGEDTFRPPYFHRNVMSEFMGLITGAYDAKAEGFVPGGASLHNSFASHGPDATTHAAASAADLVPQKVDDTLAFMFETRWPVTVAAAAYDAPHRQGGYDDVWADLPRHFETTDARGSTDGGSR